MGKFFYSFDSLPNRTLETKGKRGKDAASTLQHLFPTTNAVSSKGLLFLLPETTNMLIGTDTFVLGEYYRIFFPCGGDDNLVGGIFMKGRGE